LGGGIIGLTTAYYLRFSHKITIIEPNDRVEGASKKNAGTLCVSLPPWTTKNYLQSVKDNVNYFKRWFKGVDTMFCLVWPSLIFDSDFRNWVWLYLKYTKDIDHIDRTTKAMTQLFHFSFKNFDTVVNEITNGKPSLVDFHDDRLLEIVTSPSKI